MKAQELRIGNWVNYNGVNHQIYVIYGGLDDDFDGSVVFKGCYQPTGDALRPVDYGTPVHCKKLDPVPLTKELLLKCGFEYAGDRSDHEGVVNGNKYKYSGIAVIDVNYSWRERLPGEHRFYFCCDGAEYGEEIKHLHQLQNLYFCLCGEELNIEL